MQVQRLLSAAVSPLVDFVYPPRCPCCGASIARQNGLCAGCWQSLVIPVGPACALCRVPLRREHVGEGEELCASCTRRPPIFDDFFAGTIYTDTTRKLVLAFKHGGRIALAKLLTQFIVARMPPPGGYQLLVPVPLHRWRLWSRGYNQSALIACELERLGHGKVVVDALTRFRATPPLGSLGSKERAALLKDAIGITRGRRDVLQGANIILVDDVVTSGATTNACVKALKAAGAGRVAVACFARVHDA
jgi:ComF family protein